MPKGKRKGKSDRYTGSVQTSSSDDDESYDNASVFSHASDVRSNADEVDNAAAVDELALTEAHEEQVLASLDGLTQKSAQGRTTCFKTLTGLLQRRCTPELVYDRRMTVCDGIERGLRRGKGEEQAAAAMLAPVMCVQLGGAGGGAEALEEVWRALKPVLMTSAMDGAAGGNARAKCCTALGLVTFLAGGEMGEVLELMRLLETIFSGSYLRADDSVPNPADDVGQLHAAATGAWTLLFTLMAPGHVYTMLGGVAETNTCSPSLIQLSGLLSSRHLEVRMAAGEALAVVYELGREYQDDFADDYVSELSELLRELSKDSQKFRAKKDRKQQRATFRDILHFIEEDEQSDEQIKFGKEVLVLSTWSRRKQYDSLCTVLSSGLNIHLAENELLRDIFQLGDRIYSTGLATNKTSKLERHLMNAAAFKARTITRGKNRDKRSDF